MGRAHPLADKDGYAYAHRLAVLAPDERGLCVHHQGHDPGSLDVQAMSKMSRSAHSQLHCATRKRDEAGRWVRA